MFEIMADRYLSEDYSPETVAERTAVPAKQTRRIAAELAHAAFEQEIVLDRPWVDWAVRQHDKMIGRPVSMHAMRGVSAHSNGFQTCCRVALNWGHPQFVWRRYPETEKFRRDSHDFEEPLVARERCFGSKR